MSAQQINFMKKLPLVLLFLSLLSIFTSVSLSSAVMALGDNFANTQSFPVSYCYTQAITGWCVKASKTNLFPNYASGNNWILQTTQGLNSFTTDADNVNIKTFNDKNVLELWFQPPSVCGYNITTNDCGNTYIGSLPSAISPTFNLNGTGWVLNFDIGSLPEYPNVCSNWFCLTEYYGNTCFQGSNGTYTHFLGEHQCLNQVPIGVPQQIEATVLIQAIVNGVTHDLVYSGFQNSVPSSSTLIPVSADLSQFLTEGANIAQVNFTVRPTSQTTSFVKGAMISNVQFTPSAVFQSPALNYFHDLTSFISVPTVSMSQIGADCNSGTKCFNTCDQPDFRMSSKYDGVALGSFSFSTQQAFGCTALKTLNTQPIASVILNFVNGSSLDVSSSAIGSMESFNSPNKVNIVFPMMNVPQIKNISLAVSTDNFGETGGNPAQAVWVITFDSTNMANIETVRKSYGNSIGGTETMNGLNSLYPVIEYNNAINSNNLNHTYNLLNLGQAQSTVVVDEFINDLNGYNRFSSTETYNVPRTAQIADWFSNGYAQGFAHINFNLSLSTLGTSSWLNVSLITPEPTDNILMVVKPSSTIGGKYFNTSTIFNTSTVAGTTGCLDFCNGTTLMLHENLANNVCTHHPLAESGQCIIPITTTTSAGGNSLIGNVFTGDFGFFNSFFSPLFIEMMIMISIAGFVALKVGKNEPAKYYGQTTSNSQPVIFIAVCLFITVFYVFTGLFPPIVAFMFMVGEVAFLVYLLRGIFGGHH